MQALLVKRLMDLNREFYAQFAVQFSGARPSERVIIAPILPLLFAGARILDVGCGNGRLAKRLSDEHVAIEYVGIDMTTELVAIAKTQTLSTPDVQVEFWVADVTASSWFDTMGECKLFDIVALLAVLHHIPSFELRRDVLRSIRKLMKFGALLVMSNWQFTHNQRVLERVVDWAAVDINTNDLEEGDALLDWRRGGKGYRYCHLLTKTETERLAAGSHFQIVEQSYSANEMDLVTLLKAN